MPGHPTRDDGPETWHIDPDGDLSRTGTDALRAIAEHWDRRFRIAAHAQDPAETARSRAARDRALDEGVRRGDVFAARSRAQALAEEGAVTSAVALADQFAEVHGETVHFAVAFVLPGDDPQKVPTMLRAAQLGDRSARIEIGQMALDAHADGETMDVVAALGLVDAPEDDSSIESLVHARSAIDDAVAALLEEVAAREASGEEPGRAAHWHWYRVGEPAIEYALSTGNLDDAERYAEMGMRLTTDPARLGTFAGDDHTLLRSVHAWSRVLRERYGAEIADQRLQQEADADNVGALLAQALASVSSDAEGALDLSRSREMVDRAMRVDPRLGENWDRCLKDAALAASGEPRIFQALLQERIDHAARTSANGHHDLLLDVAKDVAPIDLRVSDSLAQRARVVGAEGSSELLDELREKQSWSRCAQDSPEGLRQRLAETALIEAIDPHAATTEHRAAAARFLELADSMGPELEGEAAASLGRAFEIAARAVEAGGEDEDLALAAMKRILTKATGPARRQHGLFDYDLDVAPVQHADVIAQRPELARGVLSGPAAERALAAAAARHTRSSDRLTSIGLTAGELSSATYCVPDMLGYDGENDGISAAQRRTSALAADQLHAALVVDPSNQRCLTVLAPHVDDVTDLPVAAIEAAARTMSHDAPVVARALAAAYLRAGHPERADEVFSVQGGPSMVAAWAKSLETRVGGVPEPMEPARWREPGQPETRAIDPGRDLDPGPGPAHDLDDDRAGRRPRLEPDEVTEDRPWSPEFDDVHRNAEPEVDGPGDAFDL